MIQLSLASALLSAAVTGPAPGTVSGDAYLQYLPPSTTIAIQFGDVSALLSKDDEDRGSWERLLADERVGGAIVATLSETGLDDALLDDGNAILRTLHGGAFGMQFLSEDPDDMSFSAALRTGDEFIPLLREFAETNEGTVVESEVDGNPTYVLSDSDESEHAVTFMEAGGLTFMFAGLREECEPRLKAMSVRADNRAEDSAPFWEGIDGRVASAMLEVLIDVEAMPEFDEEIAIAQEYVESFYAGMSMGTGNDAEFSMWVQMAENDIVSMVEDIFGEADTDLLYLAPKGAMSVQSMNINVQTLIDTVISIVDEFEPEAGAGEGYAQGLEAAQGILGLDIEEDIIDNITGDGFIVQWPSEATDLDDLAQTLGDFPVVGIEISDSEPFIDLMNAAVGLMGQLEAEIDESDDASVMTVQIAPDATLVWMIADDAFYLGNDAGRIDEVRARRGVKDSDGAFTEAEVDATIALGPAAGLGLVDLALMASSYDSMFAAFEELPEFPEEIVDAMHAMAEHIGGVSLSSFSFAGERFEIRMLTR